MIRNYNIKKLLAPAVGLQRAALLTILGFLLFLIGSALSFKLIIQPSLDHLAHNTEMLLRAVVSDEMLEQATHLIGGGFLFLGAYLMFHGIRLGIRRVTDKLLPHGLSNEQLDDIRRQYLRLRKRLCR